MVASHHQLSVVDQIEREDESSSRPVANHVSPAKIFVLSSKIFVINSKIFFIVHYYFKLFCLLSADVSSTGNNNTNDESSHQEDDEESEENSTTDSEVNLGLESEESETQGDSGGDSNSNEDSINIIDTGDSAQDNSLAAGEDAQEDDLQKVKLNPVKYF